MAARPAYQTQRPDRVSEVTVTVSAGDDRLRTIRAAAELAGISPLLDTGAPSRRWPLFVLSAVPPDSRRRLVSIGFAPDECPQRAREFRGRLVATSFDGMRP
jgi:hypothetical protein